MCYVEKINIVIDKIPVPCVMIVRKHLFVTEKVEPIDFLDTFSNNCINEEVDETNIIFISDLKGMTFFHYMEQPKSMLCGKLERNFIQEDFAAFDYIWLPNCFRHLGAVSDPDIFYDCKVL